MPTLNFEVEAPLDRKTLRPPAEFRAKSRTGTPVDVRISDFTTQAVRDMVDDVSSSLADDGVPVSNQRWAYLDITALHFEDYFEGTYIGIATVHGELFGPTEWGSDKSRYFRVDVDISATLTETSSRSMPLARGDGLVGSAMIKGKLVPLVFAKANGQNPPGYYVLLEDRRILVLASLRNTPGTLENAKSRLPLVLRGL